MLPPRANRSAQVVPGSCAGSILARTGVGKLCVATHLPSPHPEVRAAGEPRRTHPASAAPHRRCVLRGSLRSHLSMRPIGMTLHLAGSSTAVALERATHVTAPPRAHKRAQARRPEETMPLEGALHRRRLLALL